MGCLGKFKQKTFVKIFKLQPTILATSTMSDSASLEMNFKIGVLKELHKRNLITREELDTAIKKLNPHKKNLKGS